jgi:hypothetical protein
MVCRGEENRHPFTALKHELSLTFFENTRLAVALDDDNLKFIGHSFADDDVRWLTSFRPVFEYQLLLTFKSLVPCNPSATADEY